MYMRSTSNPAGHVRRTKLEFIHVLKGTKPFIVNDLVGIGFGRSGDGLNDHRRSLETRAEPIPPHTSD